MRTTSYVLGLALVLIVLEASTVRADEEIKPGMTRREVEKRFNRDGGMQFPSQTTYVYPKCDYIKLRIEFKPAPTRAEGLSPEDTVTSTSKLFVAYPTMD